MSEQLNSSLQKISAIVISIALGLIVFEIFLLSYLFQAGSFKAQEILLPWQKPFTQLGQVARIAVLFIFIYALLSRSRLTQGWNILTSEFKLNRYFIFIMVQISAFIALIYTSHLLFDTPQNNARPSPALYALWLILAVATFVLWLISIAKLTLIREFIKLEWKRLGIAFTTSVLVWFLAISSQELWSISFTSFLVDASYYVASSLLSLGVEEQNLYLNPHEHLMGVNDFVVHISPECSGYEGIGLITAFTAIYIYINRHRLRFPNVFLLLPIGIATIWLLNSARLSSLVLIGAYWSPQIAIGGFHSQAGWITFIITSLMLIWAADKSNLVTSDSANNKHKPKINLPIATLLPLVTILAVTLITSALTTNFDILYPIKVIAAGLVLFKVWHLLDLHPFKPRIFLSVTAATAVTIIWITLLGHSEESDSEFSNGLASLDDTWACIWLMFRFIGATITVPIAEELAFRSYLLCRFSHVEISNRGKIPVVITGIAISSLAFGFLHSAWLAGILAGVFYAYVRLRTHHIGDAILSHSLTNGMIFFYAAITGSWSLL